MAFKVAPTLVTWHFMRNMILPYDGQVDIESQWTILHDKDKFSFFDDKMFKEIEKHDYCMLIRFPKEKNVDADKLKQIIDFDLQNVAPWGVADDKWEQYHFDDPDKDYDYFAIPFSFEKR